MTKQEKIQEAYGEYWEKVKDYVDENGWVRNFIETPTDFLQYRLKNKILFETRIENKPNIILLFHRPKSIKGIENNNGWIKIESENDLPKIPDFYWCRDNNGAINQIHYEDIVLGYSTHYQPIVKQEPPIY